MNATIIPCPFCGEQFRYTNGIARDYVDIEPHDINGANAERNKRALV